MTDNTTAVQDAIDALPSLRALAALMALAPTFRDHSDEPEPTAEIAAAIAACVDAADDDPASFVAVVGGILEDFAAASPKACRASLNTVIELASGVELLAHVREAGKA